MNDIAIRSNLGEPLIAQININDVENSPDPDCFSVTDINSPPAFIKAALTIKQQANGYQLIIKSHQAIIEPILNLRVDHHCEPNIKQDYVLLIDPPLQNEVKVSADNPAASSLASRQADVESNTSSTYDTAKKNISKKKKVTKTAHTSSIDEKLTATYTGLPRAGANTDSRYGADVKPKSYLSISGGNPRFGDHLALPKPALRLETQIDLSRQEDALQLSPNDVMDEITAIENRMALLKTQIISLQDRNEKLKSDAENSKMQLEDSKRTLRIAAGLIALLALLAFAAWLSRKLIHERLAKTEHNWLNNSDSVSAADHFKESIAGSALAINSADKNALDANNSNFNDTFYENSTYDISSGFSAQPANAALNTIISSNANEDILESVDVLIEYGRSSLAIHLLQDYIADHPSESPKVWLKLLSVLAMHGSEAEYDQAVADCNNHYRIHMPSFADAKKVGTATIEDFPYITKELEMVWGSAAAIALLDDLIYNSESQPEEGFKPEIFEQLFMLKQMAENLNANPAKTDATTEQAPIHSNERNPNANESERSEAISKITASTATQQIEIAYETPSDALTASTNVSLPQNLSSLEAFPTLNFDDYATQHHHTEVLADNTDFQATTLSDLDAGHVLPETKPTLEAPEIDFTQHMKDVADTQNNTTPALENKQLKRSVKDSNLIDWVLTDEA